MAGFEKLISFLQSMKAFEERLVEAESDESGDSDKVYQILEEVGQDRSVTSALRSQPRCADHALGRSGLEQALFRMTKHDDKRISDLATDIIAAWKTAKAAANASRVSCPVSTPPRKQKRQRERSPSPPKLRLAAGREADALDRVLRRVDNDRRCPKRRGGAPPDRVKVALKAPGTPARHGGAVPATTITKQANLEIWKVVTSYLEEEVKLPPAKIPKDLHEFTTLEFKVTDARGEEYDPSKALLDAYTDRQCSICNETIYGACFIQERRLCHRGCIDDRRHFEVLDVDGSTPLHMNVKVPAAVLPRTWGQKPKKGHASRICDVCFSQKEFCTKEDATGEIKRFAYCKSCRDCH